jgi:predicted NUDIX family NTP pyrophosphohydrolase
LRSSAGLLMFRRRSFGLEVFLVHPGGPFWQNKDAGAWSIPKGEITPGEDLLTAARREFEEETGSKPEGCFISLGRIRQASGKIVIAWAIEGTCSEQIQSNPFVMEWPPKSGKMQAFPEIDRAQWFLLTEAKTRINPAQAAFLKRLLDHLDWKLESSNGP